MAKYTIEIDETKIGEQICAILDSILAGQLRSKYTDSGKQISAAIKELVYSRKDEIIERIVDRASRELVRVGLPKLIERMEETQ